MFLLQKSVLCISIGSGLVALLLMGGLPRGAAQTEGQKILTRRNSLPSPSVPETFAGSFRSTATLLSGRSVGAFVNADHISTENRICQLGYDRTLNDLEKSADAVVVGRPIQHLLEREHRPEWTRGSFVVERVLSRKGGIGVAAGETILLAEPVGFEHYRGTPTRLITDFCFETKKGSQYVVFINRGTDGTYGTHNYRLGRFNTDGNDCEDMKGADAEKQKLRTEIRARYNISFADSPPCFQQ